MRDHTLYFGQTAAIFTILGRFEMQPESLAFAFETWPSVASFNAGDRPAARMSKAFKPSAEDIEANREVLDAIALRVLELADVAGRGFTLQNFYINTVDKVMTVYAVGPEGDETRNISFSGDAYDVTIAENIELVTQATTVAWTHAKMNDAFLAAMVPSA